jgi:outer membrane receptor protein involved in Fe transport
VGSPADPESAAAGGVGLDEVVVTATRRQERLQDVPISISVFTQEKMDEQSIRSIDDVTRLTPGVSFTRNAMSASGNYNDEGSDINIRGIDSTGGASTVGIYIDDTPIQSRKVGFGTFNAFPVLFDLDHVEVLRGPQGTLFGAGSEGGTVRFLTPEPGLESQSGSLRTELATTQHGDPSEEYSAAIGGPIINDVLGYRFAASYRHDGGYVNREDYLTGEETQPRSNWGQTVSVRGALKWQPIEGLSIEPSFYYQELHLNDTSAYWRQLSNPSAEDFVNGNAQTNPSTDPFYLAAVRANWNLGWATLFSNSAFYSRNQYGSSDYTQFNQALYWILGYLPSYLPGPTDRATSYFTDTQNNIYQEFRLASADPTSLITWTGGLFFSHLNENSTENVYDKNINAEATAYTGTGLCAPTDTRCLTEGLIYYQPYYKVIDQETALYGEATYKILPTLKFTAGARVSRQRSTGASLYGGPFTGLTAAEVSDQSTTQTPVTPKAVLSWEPDHDNLLYLSAAKGFRIGGTNVDIGPICPTDSANFGLPIGPDGKRHTPTSYSSDSLWSYEFGGKNTLFERQLQVNWSLFLINWKNIQQNVYLPTCGLQFVANLGQARSEGGDVEFNYKPTQDLLLDFTAAYTDVHYTKNTCAGVLTYDPALGECNGPSTGDTIVRDGDRLPSAPWSFVASAEYDFKDIAWDKKPYVRVDYQYSTALHALTPANNGADGGDPTLPSQPILTDLQLRAGVRWNGIDVSLYGQNLTDAHPIAFESRDIAAQGETLYFERSVRPRTFGITGLYHF